ncbi:MAG: hypothetical protein A2Z14_05480 [Chloroflexi bacterium RBG_16_48_8]|nr:MAG: hypothetical protein A2Z14_05480 [Chloroflexi bacterium RBG_16_48_8]
MVSLGRPWPGSPTRPAIINSGIRKPSTRYDLIWRWGSCRIFLTFIWIDTGEKGFQGQEN